MKSMLARVFLLFALFLTTAGLNGQALLAQTGSIRGTLVDAETGEALIGANVAIAGTSTGAATDLNGRYVLKGLDVGTYELRASYVGYQSQTVTGVEVEAGETTRLDLELPPASYDLEEVTVEARLIRNSEAALLKDRQKAAAVSNAISAEGISQAGSATAADAMAKVTGASVVGGKHVTMRGLSGRYVNTQLNGSSLPSADPDRNSVPLDLFPAGLLDNIVASKTFTPDKAGNFTGGSINIGTKTYPDRLSISFSSSAGANSEVGIGNRILSGIGGRTALPDVLARGALPTIGEAYTNRQKAEQLDAASRSFAASPMAPARASAPVNRSYSVSFGNQFQLAGRPLGIVGSLSYDRGVSGYSGGTSGRYALTDPAAQTLGTTVRFQDDQGARETLAGGLANLSFKPLARHELGLNLMYNESLEQAARYQFGDLSRDLSGNRTFQTRVLRRTERGLQSAQLHGEHAFGSGRGVRVEWNTALAQTEQDEPDLRYFSNHFTPGGSDTTYTVAPAIYPVPTRYFREMSEASWTSDVTVTVPVGRATLKAGGSYADKDRSFRERRFEYRQDQATYQGRPDDYFAEAGLLGRDDDGLYRFGLYLTDATQPSNNYDGDQQVAAGFGMIDTPLPVLSGLRFVGGLRVEHTAMSVATLGDTPQQGALQTTDLLPSANLIYAAAGDVNLRLAYGRTLARPSFREFAPFSSFEFVGDFIFVGNPDLKRTLVHNVDVRWEWFPGAGEVMAVSGFFKDFLHPIERVVNPVAAAANQEVQYRNVARASVYGIELEADRKLDGLWNRLRHLQAGANLTLTRSAIQIAPNELERIRVYDPEADDARALQGQSPYLANLSLGYDNPERGTQANLFYNLFGPRLHAVADGPDLYEEPRHVVDLTASQRLPLGVRLKLSIKNVLGAHYQIAQTFRNTAYVNERHALGRSYSLGLTYEL